MLAWTSSTARARQSGGSALRRSDRTGSTVCLPRFVRVEGFHFRVHNCRPILSILSFPSYLSAHTRSLLYVCCMFCVVCMFCRMYLSFSFFPSLLLSFFLSFFLVCIGLSVFLYGLSAGYTFPLLQPWSTSRTSAACRSGRSRRMSGGVGRVAGGVGVERSARPTRLRPSVVRARTGTGRRARRAVGMRTMPWAPARSGPCPGRRGRGWKRNG